MTKIYLFFILLFSFQTSFARIELEQVTGQFLNIHGANWSNIAKTEHEWNEVRYWHEKIIEDPSIIADVYPQPGMVDYLLPNAIHSYGKLIGESKFSFDHQSQEVLNKLAIDLSQGKNQHDSSILEAISLTNSPWGVKTLRGLISPNDLNLNQKVFKQISNTFKRFTAHNNNSDIDTRYSNQTINFSKNQEQWAKEVFETRKLATKYFKSNPNLKKTAVFANFSKNTKTVTKLVHEKRLFSNTKSSKKHLKDKEKLINPDQKKETKRSVASTEEKIQNKNHSFFMLLAGGILFLLISIFAYRRLYK